MHNELRLKSLVVSKYTIHYNYRYLSECIFLLVSNLTGEYPYLLMSPSSDVIHLAMKHPEYADHYVTKCGKVITTGTRRFETNFTGFILIHEGDSDCNECLSSD
ncbi:MAG: hypothetical protein BAJATHORv1_40277 [Candidatus Thorarchaeota archaeon]|nr:MAG: hypothetical protein BAJATHORv1_40277 [Candidatus Thorarchaeota archaeon]